MRTSPRTVRASLVGVAASAAALGPTAVVLQSSSAAAADNAGTSGGSSGAATSLATYDGRTINLANGWQGATACAVVSPTDVQCFDTPAAMYQSGLVPKPGPQISSSPSVASGGITPDDGSINCTYGGWEYYFQNINYGGNELSILGSNFSVSDWIDLDDYGWGDTISSWKNANCYAAIGWTGQYLNGSQYVFNAAFETSWIGSQFNDSIQSLQPTQ